MMIGILLIIWEVRRYWISLINIVKNLTAPLDEPIDRVASSPAPVLVALFCGSIPL